MKKAATLKALSILLLLITVVVKSSMAQCTSTSAIYVTATGNGNGSASSPASLSNAIAIFQGDSTRTPILMAGGTYNFNNTTLQFPSGITIKGSYNDNNGVWTKNPTVTTNLVINNPPFVYDTIDDYGDTFQVVGIIGIQLNNVQNVYLQDFNVGVYNGSEHYAYSNTRDGYSIYAIYVGNSTNVQMLNLGISTDDAENGGYGGNGMDGEYANYTGNYQRMTW